MSKEDAFTIKEVITNYMEDMKQNVSEIHSKLDSVQTTANEVKIQATKTNGRVNKMEEVVEDMARIVKNHDEILLKNTTTADVTEKRSQTFWSIIKWGIIPFFSFLGWVGYLYFEHLQRVLVESTSTQVVQLLENNYDIKIK